MTSTDASDNDTTTTAPTGDATTDTPAAPTDTPTDDDKAATSAEARRYRLQLRETESARDGLASRLERMETRHVERLAGGRLAQGDDLLALGGVALDELRGDDGEVDDAKVSDAIDALIGRRPGLALPPRPPSFDSGQRPGVATPAGDWQRVLRGR